MFALPRSWPTSTDKSGSGALMSGGPTINYFGMFVRMYFMAILLNGHHITQGEVSISSFSSQVCVSLRGKGPEEAGGEQWRRPSAAESGVEGEGVLSLAHGVR